MKTPELDFQTADAVQREQTMTAMVELLHAKDQAIASLNLQVRNQEKLITALCDRLADGGAKGLPSSLQALLESFRTH